MPKSIRWILFSIVYAGLAILLAFGLFNFTRGFTACWRITSLPGLPPQSCSNQRVDALETPVLIDRKATATPTSTPEPVIPEEEYPTWDGGSRINILFVGLRGGESNEPGCPLCTDTLILLTVDPISKTAGIMSIPRDMWVNIPGFGYSRINTAWFLGKGSKLPGGGPGLSMKTVSHFIGVPVDYYVQVDFDTFVDVINLIGGVDVYNDERIVLDPVAHGKDLPKVRLTCCGTRHMNGAIALAYARCRKESQGCTDGDVGRAKRQQKVIFAIRDKVLNPQNFPNLIARGPQLYNKFSEGIHTNMSLEDAMKLAVLVRDIPRESIKNGVIDNSMVSFGNVILGGQNASVMKPLPDKIRVLRDEIFTISGPLSPLAQGGDPASLMQADGARVRILNGTSTPQLDERTANYLAQQGVQVTELGQTKAQGQTTIILYSPKLYAFRYLINALGITRSPQILIKSDPTQTADIEIRLGSDWVSKIPAGY